MAEDASAEDDELLAIRMMDGDEEALRAFLRKYGGRVRGWLRKKYGSVLQDGEIGEAFDAATMKIWENAGKFDSSRGSMGGWFLRIAQREAQTIISREIEYHAAHATLTPEMDPAGACPPDEEPEEKDKKTDKRVEDLRQVIDTLPTMQKAIIEADMAAGEPANAGRLATELGTSKNSIYVSRNKAHETIRKAMQQRGHYQNRAGRK